MAALCAGIVDVFTKRLQGLVSSPPLREPG